MDLTQIQSLKGDHVTFGDGGKGKVVGKALVSKKSEDVELWHKKLGHTNYQNMAQGCTRIASAGDQRQCVVNVKLESKPRVVTKSKTGGHNSCTGADAHGPNRSHAS
ncbi:hypothetical protein LIER_16618 [Lithospermum erythrorhizon]|uniref:GAG-pre-integrase domain-containing protein n=1 Tax=Lithospermum erythrorhizon TaxID=34254 RepID=A0AAV3Q8S8_LITER